MIKAQRNRPNKGVEGNNPQDPEAAYNVKAGSDGKIKMTYGYKSHINADEDGFIVASDFSTGNVHDSQCFTALLSGHEAAVYADSAYASAATKSGLADRGHLVKSVSRQAIEQGTKSEQQNQIAPPEYGGARVRHFEITLRHGASPLLGQSQKPDAFLSDVFGVQPQTRCFFNQKNATTTGKLRLKNEKYGHRPAKNVFLYE